MKIIAAVSFAALMATIVAANWAITTFGAVPVGFGLYAPAGVFFAGLAFGLRDVLHETGGRTAVYLAIVAGAALSYLLAAPQIALASGVAFAVSETADLAVYEPLRRRDWRVAVAASNVVGAIVDSALFLWMAFGNVDYLGGQVLAKSYMVAVSLPLVGIARRRIGAVR